MGTELFLQFYLNELALANMLFTALPSKVCLRKTPIEPLKVTEGYHKAFYNPTCMTSQCQENDVCILSTSS